MRKIEGETKTVRELLEKTKYQIDYYQREYRWEQKHALELLDDLVSKFQENYVPGRPRKEVARYDQYFLGSIIISQNEEAKYIVDGQQRLTTLTLLLILLKHLQKDRKDAVQVDDLIYSEKYGERSFNLDVPERDACMNALFEGQPFDPGETESKSVRNIYERYQDLRESFPDELKGEALPYFVDWLLDNVHLVKITTQSDADAYAVFETMNDRGLSLTPTEMLKGYLLANVPSKYRAEADRIWKSRISELSQFGKETDADFFKAWLRARYANTIRERKKGAKPEDFDRIGTEFHRWLREHATAIGLNSEDDFYQFLKRDFDFYSHWYVRLLRATNGEEQDLEQIMYIADQGFTLQFMPLLAPLLPDDPEEIARKKLRLVARYLDILLTWRIWNFRSISYSTLQYAMFVITREIRGKDLITLAELLYNRLTREEETITNPSYSQPEIGLYLHQQNRRKLHRLLARITEYVEVGSGMPSRYREYVHEEGPGRYEVEHIWPNRYEYFKGVFATESEFQQHRNRFGGLLLLPKKFNASYGDSRYEEKLPYYLQQNLLAKSLHPQAYERNPGFRQFVERTGLPFKPYDHFDRQALNERHELYRLIAERIWNPEELLREAGL